jgi:phytoene dehydrogenase-like protein
MSDCDVIVIGAGHNGLTAANYLANKNLKVKVLEANHAIGGMSSSGYPFPKAPQHMVNYCSIDLCFWQASPVSKELNLAAFGLQTKRSDPAYAYLHPDGESLCFWADANRTAEEIKYYSPQDAKAYLEYAEFLDRLMKVSLPAMLTNLARPDFGSLAKLSMAALKTLPHWSKFADFFVASGDDFLDRKFCHPIVRNFINGIPSGQYPTDRPGTAPSHLFIAFIHATGCARVVGGQQGIPNALAARLKSLGGSVETGARVTQIIVENGKAKGVVLENGSTISSAKGVIATCDPITLFTRLLPDNALSMDLKGRAKNIQSNAHGTAVLKVDIAFSGRLTLNRSQAKRRDDLDLRRPLTFFGPVTEGGKTYAKAGAGIVPTAEELMVFACIPNQEEPGQSPPGQDCLYTYTSHVPLHPTDGWEKAAAGAVDALVTQVSNYYDGIEQLEIDRYITTPDDITSRKGSTNGHTLHVDLPAFGPMRPALGLGNHRLPVKGLFLGGAGAHPSGGVSGMPGRLAAREFLRMM